MTDPGRDATRSPMAVLTIAGRRVALGSHNLLGRAPRCAVRLADPQVSSEHASLRWAAGAWQLRDLGSRNGTFVEGVPLEPGRVRAVAAGARIRLGAELVIEVVDAGPPGPAATEEGTGELVVASGGLLVLPGLDDPRVLVFEEADGAWAVEVDGEAAELGAVPRVALGDRAWTVHLPVSSGSEAVPATWDSTLRPRLDDLALEFTPSADQEQVDVRLVWPGGGLPLSSRAHLFLLFELARARLADVAARVGPSEVGWRYVDELQRALRLEPAVLNLHLFRAREQLTQAGVEGADRLFERRRQSGQLRLAIERVSVVGPDGPV